MWLKGETANEATAVVPGGETEGRNWDNGSRANRETKRSFEATNNRALYLILVGLIKFLVFSFVFIFPLNF